MTDREVMQQALEALESGLAFDTHSDVLQNLRTALEQQQAEPVATVTSETGNPDITMSWWHEPALPVGTKLYTAPPQRPWVGLTDEDVRQCSQDVVAGGAKNSVDRFAYAIEAKLKERNT